VNQEHSTPHTLNHINALSDAPGGRL
jgi:hypothetical protein